MTPPEPVDMILFCPSCHRQHIDAVESEEAYTDRLFESGWWELGGDKPAKWTNPPHRSHLCRHCGTIWRPADVPTNGVERIKTRGKADVVKRPPDPVKVAGAFEQYMDRNWPLWRNDEQSWAVERVRRAFEYASNLGRK